MKSLIVCLIIATTSVAAFAQDSLPLGQGRLYAESVSKIREVDVMLYADAVPKSGYDFRTWSGYKASFEIADQAKTLKPTITTATPEDKVYSYLRLMNTDGDVMFWGHNESLPIKVDGEWKLPDSSAAFDLNFAGLPFSFQKNVLSAEVLTKNQYGYYDSVQLAFDGKKVLLPGSLETTPGGIVRITFTDGSAVWYSTATGALLPTSSITGSVSLTFPDLWSFKDVTQVTVVVETIEKRGIQPSIEVVLAAASQISLNVSTSEGSKRPVGFWFKSAQSPDWDKIEISANAIHPIAITLPAGISYVVPEFAPGDFIPLDTYPSKG